MTRHNRYRSANDRERASIKGCKKGSIQDHSSWMHHCRFLSLSSRGDRECGLKSYLCFRSVNEGDLRSNGDLEVAWQQAKDLGICKLCSDCLEVQECIEVIGPIYRGDQLEYFYPGGHRLPVAERIANCSSHIISVLDEVYKQALTETVVKGNPSFQQIQHDKLESGQKFLKVRCPYQKHHTH